MENTILMQMTNQKAVRLLRELEELHLIKVLKQNVASVKSKLSDKCRAVFSKHDAERFNNHTQQMRNRVYNHNFFSSYVLTIVYSLIVSKLLPINTTLEEGVFIRTLR